MLGSCCGTKRVKSSSFNESIMKSDAEDDALSKLERRLNDLEAYIKPTKFRRVEIKHTFPIHDAEFSEDLVIRILGYLSKGDYLTCKVNESHQ